VEGYDLATGGLVKSCERSEAAFMSLKTFLTFLPPDTMKIFCGLCDIAHGK
jgi:hypothetical protein